MTHHQRKVDCTVRFSKTKSSTTQYYLHNAHGDVVNLTSTSGNSTKA